MTDKADRIDRYVQDYSARDLAQMVVEAEDDQVADVRATYEHAAQITEEARLAGHPERCGCSHCYVTTLRNGIAARIRALKEHVR